MWQVPAHQPEHASRSLPFSPEAAASAAAAIRLYDMLVPFMDVVTDADIREEAVYGCACH